MDVVLNCNEISVTSILKVKEEEPLNLEPELSRDPLVNVGVQCTNRVAPHSPASTSSAGRSYIESESVNHILALDLDGYVQMEVVPSSETLKSVRKGSGLQMTRKYVCNECSFSTTVKHIITNHIKRHKRCNSIHCDRCDFVGVNRSDITIHMKSRHRVEKPYMCNECPFRTSYRSGIIRHMREVHAEGKQISCSECNFKTSCDNYLMKHVKFKHRNNKPFACFTCRETFPNRTDLKHHQRAEHESRADSLFCDLCDYSSKTMYNLVHHKQTNHLNNIIDSLNSGMLT